jgi:outer membrane protein TolC
LTVVPVIVGCLLCVLTASAQPDVRLNVRIGPLAPAEVEKAAQILRSEAIDFSLLPPAGDGSVEISAGVYSVAQNAERMERRVRDLGLSPVRVVGLGRAGDDPPPAPPDPTPEPPPAPEPALYEVRYGWYDERSEADAAYRSLSEFGFEPRMLVFRESGRSTFGLGVFDDRGGAENQVAELADRGFPHGRVYRVEENEAVQRQLAAAAALSQPVIDDEPPPRPSATETSRPPDVDPEPDRHAAAAAAVAAMPEPEPDDVPTPTSAAADEAPAATDSRYRLTLFDAVTYAVEHSPELENQELQVRLSETNLRRARGLIQPKIVFDHRSTKSDPTTVEYYNQITDGANLVLEELGLPPTIPPFYYEDAHRTQVLLTQNLFSGGANRFRISGARAHRDASLARQDDQEAEVLMRVFQAFFDLARQAEVVGLRAESLARAERSLESVERRFSLGLVPRADVLRWQVQVSGERVQLIESQNIYDVGLEHFKRLIGYPPHIPLELAFLSQQEIDRLIGEGISVLERDRQSVTDDWLDSHPAVEAASRLADAARLQRRATSSDFWPTLNLDGSFGYLENDTIELDGFEQWSARLRVTFPLWDGGQRVQNRAEARTREDLADLNLRVVRDELYISDRSVVADLRADLAALENARAAVEQARETNESVTNKAALGLADYIQRIDAQVILTQSLVLETSARYQFVIDLFRWWRVREPDRLRTEAPR